MDKIEFYDDINSYLINNLELDINPDDDLVEYVAAHTNLNKESCKLVIISLFKEILKNTLKGEIVSISEFGCFYLKQFKEKPKYKTRLKQKFAFKPYRYLKRKFKNG